MCSIVVVAKKNHYFCLNPFSAEECEEETEYPQVDTSSKEDHRVGNNTNQPSKRKVLSVQCVQLLPEGESSPLKNCSRRSWQR